MNLQIEVKDATLNSYYTGIPAGKVFKVTLNEVDYYDTSATDTLVYITCPTLKQYGANNKIYLPIWTLQYLILQPILHLPYSNISISISKWRKWNK